MMKVTTVTMVKTSTVRTTIDTKGNGALGCSLSTFRTFFSNSRKQRKKKEKRKIFESF